MAMLSFRLTKEERKKLKELTKQNNYESISELIRSQFGFTPRVDGKLSDAERDQPENFDAFLKTFLQLVSRIDDMEVMVKRVLKILGDTEAAERPPHEEHWDQPVVVEGFPR